jgi:hypothetical protein
LVLRGFPADSLAGRIEDGCSNFTSSCLFGGDAQLASQFPREFKAIDGVRRSAKLPDLVKKHGSFDKFLANEKVFSYVIPNKDRVNYTTGLAL